MIITESKRHGRSSTNPGFKEQAEIARKFGETIIIYTAKVKLYML